MRKKVEGNNYFAVMTSPYRETRRSWLGLLIVMSGCFSHRRFDFFVRDEIFHVEAKTRCEISSRTKKLSRRCEKKAKGKNVLVRNELLVHIVRKVPNELFEETKKTHGPKVWMHLLRWLIKVVIGTLPINKRGDIIFPICCHFSNTRAKRSEHFVFLVRKNFGVAKRRGPFPFRNSGTKRKKTGVPLIFWAVKKPSFRTIGTKS